MSKVILVTGGVRSGKSRHAETLAKSFGMNVNYFATSIPYDDEMRDRVAIHRATRPGHWETIEEPLDLMRGIRAADALLMECMGVWLSNHLIGLGSARAEDWWDRSYQLEAKLRNELKTFLEACRTSDLNVILVTNEVGDGVVPASPIGRAFRDMLGRLNQTAASIADEVYLVTAGIPLELKRLSALHNL